MKGFLTSTEGLLTEGKANVIIDGLRDRGRKWLAGGGRMLMDIIQSISIMLTSTSCCIGDHVLNVCGFISCWVGNVSGCRLLFHHAGYDASTLSH